jgi:phage terminase large subunit-like protein
MLDTTLLTARALRYICEQNNLTPEALTWIDGPTRDRLESLTQDIAQDMQYNQLAYFRPFEYQKQFYATGAVSDRRGILAANRIGKTVCTCYETAYHLTGLYPDWWTGKRYDHSVTVFVAGESWQQTAMVLQNELTGTPDSKLIAQIGTGSIPRHTIVKETIRSEGANIISIEVKHTAGGRSRLVFGNYTQEVRNLQGFKLDFVVLDEQPPDDFFSELVTRTATTQGQVLCSFTPLKGLNGLVSKFWNHEQGYNYIRVAWDDVPEYNLWHEPFLLKSTRAQLERDYLPHEREARIAGKPVMGQGAVFQLRSWPTYKTGDYVFRDMRNVQRVIALDLGLVKDRTVISLMYWEPNEAIAWLHTQITVRGIDEANPVAYINNLMRPEVFGCPIVLPADASTQGRYTMSSLSIRQLFESYELNVHPKPIMNPPDSEGRVTNHKSFGINTMRQMLEGGTLLVNENCVEFLREAQNYYVDPQGRFSDPDDCIDSARYALLACLNGYAEPYDNMSRHAKQEHYRDIIYNAANRTTKSKLKQAFDPGA